MLHAAIALAALAGGLSADTVDDYQYVSHTQMAERMSSCGFDAVEISYEDYLQSDVVRIADQAATDEQINCLINGPRKTFYVVEVEQPLAPKYYERLDVVTRPEIIAKYRAWFAARPEFADPPKRQIGESDDDLAQRIEDFCGPKAVGAFAREYGILTFSHEWMQGLMNDLAAHSEISTCVFYAASLSNLPIGLVGNEKVSD